MSADDDTPELTKAKLLKESKKKEVIEILIEGLWPTGTPKPEGPMIVINDNVVSAITERNKRYTAPKDKLSTNNPANFLKDFIRHTTCNENWPQRLWDERITARQRYGDKQVLEFVSWRDGDDRPFPDRFDPKPGEEIPVLAFEALSIPREARALGREDEPWLIQVIVSQRLINTHFSVVASRAGLHVDTLAHLQMSVKTQPEIDATFVAGVKGKDDEGKDIEYRAYVTGEAKQIGERILEDQIREQVAKAFEITRELQGAEAIHAVIPVAFKVIRYPIEPGAVDSRRGIYLAQFKPIMRSEFDKKYGDKSKLHEMPLVLQSKAFYEPFPPIRGISYKNPVKPKLPKAGKPKTVKPKKSKKEPEAVPNGAESAEG